MKQISEHQKRKKEMFNFLSNNIIPKHELIDENTFKLKDNKEEFLIHTISKEEEFKELINFKYTFDTKKLDNDKYELKGMLEKLIDHIVRINETTNEIPGFILLQSETDFKQANKDKREDTIVNKIGFNKQLLGTEYRNNPFPDIRKLTQTELIIWKLTQMNFGYNQTMMRYVEHKGFYYPELVFYNPNKQHIESGIYAQYKTNKYATPRFTTCPTCGKGSEFQHTNCRTDEYIKEVIKRTEKRYFKYFKIDKKRFEKIQGSRDPKSGIQFKKVKINKNYLKIHGYNKLKKEEYHIAMLK